jgi:hypothetical protein
MNKKDGCPGCGGDKFKDNNGVDHSLGHGGLRGVWGRYHRLLDCHACRVTDRPIVWILP